MASLDDVGTLTHHNLLALIWSCFAGAFLFVALRTVIRLRVAPRLAAEDYWILFALATHLALCILQTIQLPSLYYLTALVAGVIPPSLDIIAHTKEYVKYEFAIVLLFWTVLWSVKASFLSLYYKLFKELAVYRHVWYALAVFTFLAYAGCWITLGMSCGPISNFFGFETCATDEDIWRSNLSVYYSTTVDVFTDLCIMAMPLRLIYNVKVSGWQKLGLICVFGLGFVMIAFAIIRANQVLVPAYFVNLTLLMVWSTLAATVSLIVVSLPAFKMFLVSRSTAKRSRNGQSGGSSRNPHSAKDIEIRGKGIQLGSFSSGRSANRRPLGTSDSQVEILQVDGSKFVTVKDDIEHTAAPPLTYHPTNQGQPF